jgi:hypothetical protein
MTSAIIALGAKLTRNWRSAFPLIEAESASEIRELSRLPACRLGSTGACLRPEFHTAAGDGREIENDRSGEEIPVWVSDSAAFAIMERLPVLKSRETNCRALICKCSTASAAN